MSKRITTKTDITNKDLAIQALEIAGLSYQEEANTLLITSGALNGARVNLRTGDITGDTDWHSHDTLGALRQHYTEAQIRQLCLMEGHFIEERQVLQDGRIRIVCSGMFV